MPDSDKPTPARPETTWRGIVPFHDLDPMQVVWHGNYLKYFENARHQLFEQLNVDLVQYWRDEDVLFPIVRSSVKHIRPLRYRDEFDCVARLTDSRRKIVVAFELRLTRDGSLCAKGETVQVAIRGPEMALELEIPQEIRRPLERS